VFCVKFKITKAVEFGCHFLEKWTRKLILTAATFQFEMPISAYSRLADKSKERMYAPNYAAGGAYRAINMHHETSHRENNANSSAPANKVAAGQNVHQIISGRRLVLRGNCFSAKQGLSETL